MRWKIEIWVRCPWRCDRFFTDHQHHHLLSQSSLAFFASPPGSLNDFSRHALNVPGLYSLCRLEHAGISKQWNLCAEIEFITTLPTQITSLNGAAIRAMGFDFEVFYCCPFWISLPLFFSFHSPSPPMPHLSVTSQTSALMLWGPECLWFGCRDECVCVCTYFSLLDACKHQLLVHDYLFTRLHPFAALGPYPHKTCRY